MNEEIVNILLKDKTDEQVLQEELAYINDKKNEIQIEQFEKDLADLALDDNLLNINEYYAIIKKFDLKELQYKILMYKLATNFSLTKIAEILKISKWWCWKNSNDKNFKLCHEALKNAQSKVVMTRLRDIATDTAQELFNSKDEKIKLELVRLFLPQVKLSEIGHNVNINMNNRSPVPQQDIKVIK